jgi:hypothetical protein
METEIEAVAEPVRPASQPTEGAEEADDDETADELEPSILHVLNEDNVVNYVHVIIFVIFYYGFDVWNIVPRACHSFGRVVRNYVEYVKSYYTNNRVVVEKE